MVSKKDMRRGDLGSTHLHHHLRIQVWPRDSRPLCWTSQRKEWWRCHWYI